MNNPLSLRLVSLIALFSLSPFFSLLSSAHSSALPLTGPATAATAFATARYSLTPTLDFFMSRVVNGDPSQVVGVYSPGILALRVAQQPAANPGFVSTTFGYATRFALASAYGTTGLLAHNYLSGALFFQLTPGTTVSLVRGDGSVQRYAVSSVRRFQALSPTDPYSSFVDLDNGGAQLSSTELFYQVYRGNGQVVFQTCIAAQGNSSWGRLFVIATPIQ